MSTTTTSTSKKRKKPVKVYSALKSNPKLKDIKQKIVALQQEENILRQESID